MGIIRNGTIIIDGKKLRIKVFGYVKKTDGEFIQQDIYISQTDLINIGILNDE